LLSIARLDIHRLLCRRRFWPAVLLTAAAACVVVLAYYRQVDYGLPANACHATVISLGQTLMFTLPLFAGFTAGDSLAVDRHSGFIRVLLSRCGNAQRYLLAKAAATAVVVSVGTLVVYLLVFMVAALCLPLTPPGPTITEAHFFAESIFWATPLGYVALCWLLHALAGTTLAWTGLFASLWVKTPHLAGGVPMAVCIAGTYGLLYVVGEFVPLAVLGIHSGLTPVSVLLYWLVMGVIILVAAVPIFGRRDIWD